MYVSFLILTIVELETVFIEEYNNYNLRHELTENDTKKLAYLPMKYFIFKIRSKRLASDTNIKTSYCLAHSRLETTYYELWIYPAIGYGSGMKQLNIFSNHYFFI